MTVERPVIDDDHKNDHCQEPRHQRDENGMNSGVLDVKEIRHTDADNSANPNDRPHCSRETFVLRIDTQVAVLDYRVVSLQCFVVKGLLAIVGRLESE